MQPMENIQHSRNRIKEETVKLITANDFKYLITLNLNDLKDELKTNYIIHKFIKLLNNEVFGKRSKKALNLVVSLERHTLGSYHVHILAENPVVRIENLERKLKFNFRILAKQCWESAGKETARISTSCPDGESWFKDITDPHGAADYICKEMDQGRADVIQWDACNLKGRRYY